MENIEVATTGELLRNKIVKIKEPVFNNHKLNPKRDIKLSDKFII